ncbi:hypothetical protein VTO73DRAFT_10437 [Trametes versicolor]
MTSYSLLDPLLGLDRCTLLTTFYESPTAGEVMSQDIDQLRKSIDAINGLFDKVMRPLQAFDYEYSISSEAQDALAPQWAAFRTRFNMCVDSSRDSAAAASRIMHLYADAVLGKVGDVRCDVRALLEEIKIFEEKVQEHIAAAQVVRDSFNKIANDIRGFRQHVILTANLKSVTGPLSEAMTHAFNNIVVLEEKVSNVPKKFTDQEAAYLAMLAALTPSAAKLLCTLSPTTAIQALQFVLGAPNHTLAQAELAQGTVTLQDICNVSQRIEAVANIWHNVCPCRTLYPPFVKSSSPFLLCCASQILKPYVNCLPTQLRLDLVSLETSLNTRSGDEDVANSTFLAPKIYASRAMFTRLTECLDLPYNAAAHAVCPNELFFRLAFNASTISSADTDPSYAPSDKHATPHPQPLCAVGHIVGARHDTALRHVLSVRREGHWRMKRESAYIDASPSSVLQIGKPQSRAPLTVI